MAIRYALYENNVTSTPAVYMARTRTIGCANLDQIAARMADMGTTVTKADILAVFEDMSKAAVSLLADGFSVNFDGLCNLRCTIKGNFDGLSDSFDPARHSLNISANPGGQLLKAVTSTAEITQTETVIPTPAPAEFVDCSSDETNNTITPGNIGTVNGWRLKFDPAVADEGVFLIADDGSEIKAGSVSSNKAGHLTFLVPDLAGFAPDFRLEVRSRMAIDGGQLRTGRLDETLIRA